MNSEELGEIRKDSSNGGRNSGSDSFVEEGQSEPRTITVNGITWGTVSTICLTVGFALSKYLLNKGTIAPYDIVYFQSLGSIVLGLLYLRLIKEYLLKIDISVTGTVFLTTFLYFIEMSGLFTSIYYLSVTETMLLMCIRYILTTILEWMFFSARLSVIDIAGIITGLGSVILVAYSHLMTPGQREEHSKFVIGMAGGLIGAVAGALSAALYRAIQPKVHFVSMHVFAALATCLFVPSLSLTYSELSGLTSHYAPSAFLILALITLSYTFSLFALFKGFFKEKNIARLTLYQYLSLIITPFIDLCFGYSFYWTTFIAILLIGVNFLGGLVRLGGTG